MFLHVFLFFMFCALIRSDERGGRFRRIVGGGPANIPPPDDPVVYTRFNGKTAAVRGVLDFPHYVFRGVRYAKPPVGNLRFVRPQETFLEGIVNATNLPPPCVQPIPRTDKIVGEEDCLFLNIFTPDLPTGMEGLPVVVWIHGGGFRYGSASQYGVRHLVGKNLVVVTIQYRLGSLGFLSGGNREIPGNAGLWDMALAIQFIRNYIGFFGGNPFKIVVMGQGTGASSALTVALTEIAKGNTAGVVAMSGTAVSHWALDNTPVNTARALAERNGCPVNSALTMVKCLQKLNPQQIIAGDSYIEFERLQQRGFQNGFGGLGAAPVYEGRHDGRSLPSLVQNKPIEDLANNNVPKIPLLLGTTKDETKRACTEVFNDDIFKSLTTIPNFLENVLVKSLQQQIQLPKLPISFGDSNSTLGLNSLLQAFNPGKFSKYMAVPANDFQAAFSKVAQATTDALFNAPAFLTANMWSKESDTFLYKFEHSGKLKKGNFFLNGFSLGGFLGKENKTVSEVSPDDVSHGDELAYLFDPQNLDGTPVEEDSAISEDDKRVRDHFTQMISDFARQGQVKIGNKPVGSFSPTTNNFVQIKPDLKVNDNFQFCEMGLWLGLAQRMQSSLCGFLNVLDSELQNAQKSFFDTLNKTNTGLSDLTHGLIPKPSITKPSLPNLNPFNIVGNKKEPEKQMALPDLFRPNLIPLNNVFQPKNPKQQQSNLLNPFRQSMKSSKKRDDDNINSSIEKMSKPLSVFQGSNNIMGGLLG